MTEHLSSRTEQLGPFEQASRHLLETLGMYGPAELRDTPHKVVWDAQEYAMTIASQVEAKDFNDQELADASFAYGSRSFAEPVQPGRVLQILKSSHFTELRHKVWEHVPESDVRSLIFFSQGVKYAARLLRAKRLHDRRL